MREIALSAATAVALDEMSAAVCISVHKRAVVPCAQRLRAGLGMHKVAVGPKRARSRLELETGLPFKCPRKINKERKEEQRKKKEEKRKRNNTRV